MINQSGDIYHVPQFLTDISVTNNTWPPVLITTIPQGWQCPVCKKVHAPWVAGCDCYQTISMKGERWENHESR